MRRNRAPSSRLSPPLPMAAWGWDSTRSGMPPASWHAVVARRHGRCRSSCSTTGSSRASPTRPRTSSGRTALAHVAAPLAPTGSAVRTANGWRIDGRWEWATGVNHSDWVMVHALDDHTPPPQGSPFATRFALVPRSSVTVEDVWFTSGMCATGSNSRACRGRRCAGPSHRGWHRDARTRLGR